MCEGGRPRDGERGAMVGMAKQRSIHFVPALFLAGAFNLATGVAWDVPMCVQPMKTIAAVALTEGLRVRAAACRARRW